jgi:hypothetical protein
MPTTSAASATAPASSVLDSKAWRRDAADPRRTERSIVLALFVISSAHARTHDAGRKPGNPITTSVSYIFYRSMWGIFALLASARVNVDFNTPLRACVCRTSQRRHKLPNATRTLIAKLRHVVKYVLDSESTVTIQKTDLTNDNAMCRPHFCDLKKMLITLRAASERMSNSLHQHLTRVQARNK